MFETVPPEKRLSYFNQQLNPKRQVKFKTCADVYDHWRSCKKRLYRKAPKDGVEFQVDYIDTGLSLSEEQRAKAPIALALHGAPGSYHDYALLINHLSQQDVRVIAPNFPEYIATVKTKVLFRHSADEKAAYLRDFLKAINVNKIDLLVSHSSAIFPTLLILLNANNEAIARQKQQQQQQQNPQVQDHNQTDPSISPSRSSSSSSLSIVAKSVPLKFQEKTANGDAPTIDNQQFDNGSNDADEWQDDEEATEDKFEDAKDDIDNNNNNNKTNNNNHVQEHINHNHELNDKQEQQQQQEVILDGGTGGKENINGDFKKKSKRKSEKLKAKDVTVKFDQVIEIKAVALFNPAGHRLPKSMKPTWFKCGSVRVYQHKLGRSLFRKLGPAFLTVVGVPVRVDNMDNVMLSATVMRNSRCQRVVQQLEQLSQMKLPTLLVFSENDKLIEKEIFYEMSQFMKLDSKNFDIFNNDGDIELSRKY